MAENIGTANFRTRIAEGLGIGQERKEVLYIDLARAATLRDAVYWLQILFAAGIATLGLVLNSPAVIIGAMLISPLMNPILAAGLALASGDVILGLRAVVNLFLSCAVAIALAATLTVLLPFREITSEIAARTQPNSLDLLVALFSGAVGVVATCREVKGVVTSIPGVAIAVALMPPLCTVGFGIGLMLTFDQATGLRVASGGGLLFLTNLVAITFTAMIVFLLVQLDTPRVEAKAEAWENQDPESRFIINLLNRFPRFARAREIRSLTVRFAVILLPLALILVPLSRSFTQLQREIGQKSRENLMRAEVLELWQKHLQKNSAGVARSSIDQLTIAEKDDKLSVNLRVFDDQPYTAAEKKNFLKLLAAELGKPAESIALQLVEIPTTSVLAQLETQRERKPIEPLSIAELQAQLRQRVDGSLRQVELPAGARVLHNEVAAAAPDDALHVKMTYLCAQPIAPEQQSSLVETVRQKLQDKAANVTLERVPTDIGFVQFARNRAELPILAMIQLDFAGRVMRENPQLRLLVAAQPFAGERPEIVQERINAVKNYLETRWQIEPNKVAAATRAEAAGRTWLGFEIVEAAAAPAQTVAESAKGV